MKYSEILKYFIRRIPQVILQTWGEDEEKAGD